MITMRYGRGLRPRSQLNLYLFQILQHYLSSPLLVPITLNHFKMLARLGRAPVWVSLDPILLRLNIRL